MSLPNRSIHITRASKLPLTVHEAWAFVGYGYLGQLLNRTSPLFAADHRKQTPLLVLIKPNITLWLLYGGGVAWCGLGGVGVIKVAAVRKWPAAAGCCDGGGWCSGGAGCRKAAAVERVARERRWRMGSDRSEG
nr:hypothetical protein [Tanacetum cinerariifolium]